MSAVYTFQRGEDVSIALDIEAGGTVGDVSAVSARLRRLAPGKRVLSPADPIAATFSVAPRAAAGDIPEGWTFTIPASTSIDLDAGHYLADARLTIAGGVVTTDPITVLIFEPATVA